MAVHVSLDKPDATFGISWDLRNIARLKIINDGYQRAWILSQRKRECSANISSAPCY